MSDERKYYCMCDSNCKFETMTKEQILAAIAQAVETGSVGDCDTGFVTKLKETNGGGYVTLWVGTRAQYEKIAEKAMNCIYVIEDDTTADDIAKALEDMQKSVDEAAEHAATRAPWGLVTMTKDIDSFDTLNETVKSVLKSMPVHTKTIISCRCAFDFMKGAHITISKAMNYSGAEDAKVLFEDSEGITMQCFAYNNILSDYEWALTEWEYINPPMEYRREYRTTERHCGLPVYVWRGDFVMGTSGEPVEREITANATEAYNILSIDAIAYDRLNERRATPIPAFSITGELMATCDVYALEKANGDMRLIARACSIKDMVGYTATITVKYTK